MNGTSSADRHCSQKYSADSPSRHNSVTKIYQPQPAPSLHPLDKIGAGRFRF
ncbi:MAG: hypothetical protein ACK5CA_01505 [Cyanobacteriota bacterium]